MNSWSRHLWIPASYNKWHKATEGTSLEGATGHQPALTQIKGDFKLRSKFYIISGSSEHCPAKYFAVYTRMGIHNLLALPLPKFSHLPSAFFFLISNWNFARCNLCSLCLIFFCTPLRRTWPLYKHSTEIRCPLSLLHPFQTQAPQSFFVYPGHICVPPLDFLQFVIVLKAPDATCLSREDLKSAEIEKIITWPPVDTV